MEGWPTDFVLLRKSGPSVLLSGELFCDVLLNSPHYIKKRWRMGELCRGACCGVLLMMDLYYTSLLGCDRGMSRRL